MSDSVDGEHGAHADGDPPDPDIPPPPPPSSPGNEPGASVPPPPESREGVASPPAPSFAPEPNRPPAGAASRWRTLPSGTKAAVGGGLALALLAAVLVIVMTRGGDSADPVVADPATTTAIPTTEERSTTVAATSTTVRPSTTTSTSTTSTTSTTTTSSTSTSSTSTTSTLPPVRTTTLASLEPTEGAWALTESISIDGTTYPGSLNHPACDNVAYWTYAIPNGMVGFETVVGMTDTTPSDWSTFVEFRVDGRRTALVQTSFGTPQPVAFDFGGGENLGIAFYRAGGSGCGTGVGPTLGSPRFLSSAPAAPANAAPDAQPFSYLDRVELVLGSWDYTERVVSINGSLQPRSMGHADCSGRSGPFTFEYNLGRNYTTFDATIGLTDHSAADWQTHYDFYVDGQLALAQDIALGQSVQANFPVTGALRLQIVISTLAGGDCSDEFVGPALGSPRLFLDPAAPATQPLATPVSTYLDSVEMVEDSPTFGRNEAAPISGGWYDHSLIQHDCGGDSGPFTYEYNLGRRFTTFSAVAGVTDHTATGWQSRFDFLVDGQAVLSQNVTVGQATPISFPVQDGLRLTVVITTLSGGYCSSDEAVGAVLGSPGFT